jgi:hypothetical protein
MNDTETEKELLAEIHACRRATAGAWAALRGVRLAESAVRGAAVGACGYVPSWCSGALSSAQIRADQEYAAASKAETEANGAFSKYMDQKIAAASAAAAGEVPAAAPAEDELEPYCAECGAVIGIFHGDGGSWRHFRNTGTADEPWVELYDAGHEPVQALRTPATAAAAGMIQ